MICLFSRGLFLRLHKQEAVYFFGYRLMVKYILCRHFTIIKELKAQTLLLRMTGEVNLYAKVRFYS